MNIEIITIGDEILAGKTLDTNFQFLAHQFLNRGIQVKRHITVSDSEEDIKEAILMALKRSDVIFTTGGLGPTLDDKTKKVIADIFETPLVEDALVKEDLLKRYGPQLSSIKEQSEVPQKATILKNFSGTAPGFYFYQDHKHLFVLPGVPLEMEAMFEKEVIKKLNQLESKEEKFYTQTLCFCHLPENILDPSLREIKKNYPYVDLGIYPSYGYLSVQLKIKEKSEDLALKKLSECRKILRKKFATYLYSEKDVRIEKAIHDYFIENHMTLALAESITGGHIAAKLTAIPGSSKYFLGSVVSYANSMKQSFLGVQEKSLKEFGAVSEPVVKEMAEGLLKRSSATIALAISGVAGPEGGSEKKPIGTVWCAIAQKNFETLAWKIQAKGRAKRSSVIEYAANYILSALWRWQYHKQQPFIP